MMTASLHYYDNALPRLHEIQATFVSKGLISSKLLSMHTPPTYMCIYSLVPRRPFYHLGMRLMCIIPLHACHSVWYIDTLYICTCWGSGIDLSKLIHTRRISVKSFILTSSNNPWASEEVYCTVAQKLLTYIKPHKCETGREITILYHENFMLLKFMNFNLSQKYSSWNCICTYGCGEHLWNFYSWKVWKHRVYSIFKKISQHENFLM